MTQHAMYSVGLCHESVTVSLLSSEPLWCSIAMCMSFMIGLQCPIPAGLQQAWTGLLIILMTKEHILRTPQVHLPFEEEYLMRKTACC